MHCVCMWVCRTLCTCGSITSAYMKVHMCTWTCTYVLNTYACGGMHSVHGCVCAVSSHRYLLLFKNEMILASGKFVLLKIKGRKEGWKEEERRGGEERREERREENRVWEGRRGEGIEGERRGRNLKLFLCSLSFPPSIPLSHSLVNQSFKLV